MCGFGRLRRLIRDEGRSAMFENFTPNQHNFAMISCILKEIGAADSVIAQIPATHLGTAGDLYEADFDGYHLTWTYPLRFWFLTVIIEQA
jgi:hypothetical protein